MINLVSHRAVTQPLPDFLVIGAPKAGTTSLSLYLAGHPSVHVAPVKEVRFFDQDDRWSRGIGWYRQQFAGSSEKRCRGEATPGYLTSPVAAARMARVVPEARLIVLLRQPAARAYSAYWEIVAWRGESRSFDEIVGSWHNLADCSADPYLWGSRYLPQLRAYCEYFSSEQILVLLTEDLRKDPSSVFTRVCDFLGVERYIPDGLGTLHNGSHRYRSRYLRLFMEGIWTYFPESLMRKLDSLNSVPLSYPPIPAGCEHAIMNLLAEENAELASRFGLDISAWNPWTRAV